MLKQPIRVYSANECKAEIMKDIMARIAQFEASAESGKHDAKGRDNCLVISYVLRTMIDDIDANLITTES